MQENVKLTYMEKVRRAVKNGRSDAKLTPFDSGQASLAGGVPSKG